MRCSSIGLFFFFFLFPLRSSSQRRRPGWTLDLAEKYNFRNSGSGHSLTRQTVVIPARSTSVRLATGYQCNFASFVVSCQTLNMVRCVGIVYVYGCECVCMCVCVCVGSSFHLSSRHFAFALFLLFFGAMRWRGGLRVGCSDGW